MQPNKFWIFNLDGLRCASPFRQGHKKQLGPNKIDNVNHNVIIKLWV